MKFVRIRDNLKVAVDKIEAVETQDESSCLVYVAGTVFKSNMPSISLLQLIEISSENETDKEEKKEKVLENLNAVLKADGHFAG